MWETIKNDPILKTAAIIILSVLGFGFAFNIMFGPSNTGMGEGHGNGGYPAGNVLSYLLVLAFNLLLIVMIIAALIAVCKFAKVHLLKGGESKVFEKIKKDPLLKGILITVSIIVVIAIVHCLFLRSAGYGYGYGMMDGRYGYNMMWNYGYGSGLTGLLVLLLKLVIFTSVIGVIAGIVMYLKQSYGKAAAAVKEKCTSCGADLKAEWKCCPVCGNEKGVKE